jgi:hypothetical protein
MITDSLRINEWIDRNLTTPLSIDYRQEISIDKSGGGGHFEFRKPTRNAILDTDFWVCQEITVAQTDGYLPDRPGGIAPPDNDPPFTDTVDLNVIREMFASDPGRIPLPQSLNYYTNISEMQKFKMALRQGWWFNKAINNFKMSMNGHDVVHTLQSTMPGADFAIQRKYLSKWENEVLLHGQGADQDEIPISYDFYSGSSMIKSGDLTTSKLALGTRSSQIMSGSEAIVGPPIVPPAPPIDDNEANAAISSNNIGLTRSFTNWGFTKRTDFIYDKLAGNTSPDSDNRGVNDTMIDEAGPITFKVYSRINWSPLKLYQNRDGSQHIPHITDLKLSWTYITDPVLFNEATFINTATPFAQETSVQIGEAALAFAGLRKVTGTSISVKVSGAPPSLYFKWIIPPVTFNIPPKVSMPIYEYEYHSSTNTMEAAFFGEGIRTNRISNIPLRKTPKCFIIYNFTIPGEHPERYMNETISAIDELTVSSTECSCSHTFDTWQLYQLYLKNCDSDYKIPWDIYKKYLCYVYIKPEDIGLNRQHSGQMHISFSIIYRDYQIMRVSRKELIGRPLLAPIAIPVMERDISNWISSNDVGDTQLMTLLVEYQNRLHVAPDSLFIDR